MMFDSRPIFASVLLFGIVVGILVASAWAALGWQLFTTVAVSMAFGAFTDRFFRSLFQ